ncbi:MAG: glycosyltransferase [Ignavibacteriales bacterium]|nr:glycosyltransferase [Ignavibacteriales bacterium]
MHEEFNIDKVITFTGYIEYKNIEQYHNMLDIYLALSVMDDESFGVAILEAGACEKPVMLQMLEVSPRSG